MSNRRSIDMGLLIASALWVPASTGVSMQRIAEQGNDPHGICLRQINTASQDAYESCKQYLKEASSADTKRVQYVRRWIAEYEKNKPYVEFLRSLTDDQEAHWVFYQQDLEIELPETSEKEGPYKIEIARAFSDSIEGAVLRKAEALYPGPRAMIHDLFLSLGKPISEAPREMAPLWGTRGNDNIELTHTVTARAVRYYYDLTLAARKNAHLQTGFTAEATTLRYLAGIKHVDHYSHGNDSFENVYVADLTLEWGFLCGGLCGMGFTRNKVVVLDGDSNVLAMYLDAPVNSSLWVS